VVRGVDIPSS
jgi:hypothetical protein